MKIILGSWSDQTIRGFEDTRPQSRCVAEGGPAPLILTILRPQPPKCLDDRATPWEMLCCCYFFCVCFEVFQAGSHRLSQADLGLGELSVPAPRALGSKASATTGDIYLFTIILRQDLPP